MKTNLVDQCIVVVDDNHDLRTLYQEALSMDGHDVALASNGKEALEMLMASETRPSVIFLDLMMPVMDGWEFLREREKVPGLAELPVVVFSASKENLPQGFRFLKKPIELGEFLAVAEEFCMRHGGRR